MFGSAQEYKAVFVVTTLIACLRQHMLNVSMFQPMVVEYQDSFEWINVSFPYGMFTLLFNTI